VVLKATPLLRGRGDVEALRRALREGLIDIVATDHAPHSPAEKAAAYPAFADIPGGMPGLQMLLSAMLKLVDEGLVTVKDVVRMCSANPAQRFGLGRRKGRIARGFDADLLVLDLLVLDPRQTSTVTAAEQRSRAGYTPFEGLAVSARLIRVFLAGREIVCEGRLADESAGRVVTRLS
jgi:dihydroorotase